MTLNRIFNICLTAGAMACALTACDDDKQLTLDGNEVKLMNEITFDLSSTLPLPVGMDTTISYTYGPMDAVTSTIVFSSSDESVAKVDQNGKITGIGVGEATILARPEGFDYKVYDAEASVLVKVIEKLIPVEKIILTNITPVTSEDGKIFVTDEFQLSAEILPADHTYSRLVWGTTNADIATVDQTGKVVCTGEGDVIIYAIATDRTGVTGEYKLHVDRYIAAEKVTIKPLDGPTRLYAGTVTLDVVYDPVGATVGSVDWMSDNESVATVRRGVVTPVGFGTANIIATCVETGYQTSIPVTVEAGWFIWDASNQWNPWVVSDYNNHILRDERGDKVWRLYFKVPAAGGKWRGDIKVNCSTSNLFNMSLANYPVLAVRMTKMNGGNSTLDCVFDGYGNAGNPNPKNGIDLGDGTQLLIYNLGAAKNYAGVDIASFRVFQIKLADIPYDNVDQSKPYYDVYWIRTFKSEDEAKAYAADDVAKGN